VPTPLQRVGIDQVLRLPVGWTISTSGVQSSGPYLIFGASPTTGHAGGSATDTGTAPPAVATWIVDKTTGRGYRYPLVNAGWYAATEVGADGWVVRKEIQQLPGSQCGSAANQDCFRWRLYAQTLPLGAPKLISESTKPGPQMNSPSVISDGQQIVWEVNDAKEFDVDTWSPTQQRPVQLAVRPQFGQPQLAAGQLYLIDGGTPTGAGECHCNIISISDASPHSAVKAGTFTGSPIAAVGSQGYVYFSGSGTSSEPWTFVNRNGQRLRLDDKVISPYYLIWIGSSHLLSWSATGYQLFSINPKSKVLQLAGPDVDLPVPRSDGQAINLAYIEPTTNISVIGTTQLP
jgi:hypothetical protein